MPRLCLPALLPLLAVTPLRAESPIAEIVCDRTPRLEARLTRMMRQQRHAMGLLDPEQVMEVWLAPTGDWSLVAAYADGTSCILAMGEAWQGLAPPVARGLSPEGATAAGEGPAGSGPAGESLSDAGQATAERLRGEDQDEPAAQRDPT